MNGRTPRPDRAATAAAAQQAHSSGERNRRPPPSRRALLRGAGVAVGAGAIGAGVTLAATQSSTPPKTPPPGEMLMNEHGVLKRLLLAYRETASQLAGGRTPPATAVVSATPRSSRTTSTASTKAWKRPTSSPGCSTAMASAI